jgi:hypothetical protein
MGADVAASFAIGSHQSLAYHWRESAEHPCQFMDVGRFA